MPRSIPTFLYLNGTAGNDVYSPDSSALNITSDIDIIIRLQPRTWRPVENKLIIGKYSSSNARAYQIQLLTTGIVRLTLSQAGTAGIDANSSIPVPLSNTANPKWLRVTWRSSDKRVQFFLNDDSPTVPTTWTQLGSDQTVNITGIFANTELFRIGTNSARLNNFQGKIYRIILKAGIDGTTVYDADFSNKPAYTSSFYESSPNAAPVYIQIYSTIPYPSYIQGRDTSRRRNTPVEVAGVATVNTQTTPTITKTTTPFNGNKIATSVSLYTPIWSNSTYVYHADTAVIGGTQQTRLVKYLKSNMSVVEDVQTYVATLDLDPGHRQASASVTSNGTVLHFPEAHNITNINTAWRHQHSTTADSLSTLTSTTAAYGYARNSYRRYYRNPTDGGIWMTYRGDGYYGYVAKWDDVAKQWVSKPTQINIAGYGSAFANSVYGLEMAFSGSTIYILIEWSDGGTGNPRRDACVAKSTDDGATWTTMTGSILSLPIKPGDTHVSYESPGSIRNVVCARLAIDNNGVVHVISAYRKSSDTFRSLYDAKWNSTTQQFEYIKVIPFITTDIGNVSTMSYNGHMYVLFSQYDEHNDVNWSTTSNTVAWARKGALILLDSADGGATWNKYVLDDGLGSDAFFGGYFDPECKRLDNIIRILPMNGTTYSSSQIWTMSI
jgi:hypothetical protein